jgi:hypothetical protein
LALVLGDRTALCRLTIFGSCSFALFSATSIQKGFAAKQTSMATNKRANEVNEWRFWWWWWWAGSVEKKMRFNPDFAVAQPILCPGTGVALLL